MDIHATHDNVLWGSYKKRNRKRRNGKLRNVEMNWKWSSKTLGNNATQLVYFLYLAHQDDAVIPILHGI